MKCKYIKLNEYTDNRGSLFVAESKQEIPFEAKRVFLIKNCKADSVRGEHANYCSEAIICVSGSCKLEADYIDEKELFILDKPMTGVFLPPLMWKRIYDFSEDCVLLVLADEVYDVERVIYSYDDYLKLADKRNKQ